MKFLQPLFIAMSMYTKIKMPKTEWDEKNMRYAMCWFPAAGLLVGALFYVWVYLAFYLSVGQIMFAAVAAAIPVLVTGGIHLDGFCDTVDAVSSYKSREEKLEIMKDPHTGAFGVIFTALYLLVWMGTVSEITDGYLSFAVSFALTRALSGIGVMTIPCAKNSGLAKTFSDGANKKRCTWILAVQAIIYAAVMIWKSPVMGSFGVAGACGVYLYYRRFAMKNFGGITGDTAGWFLQTAELAVLICMIFGGKVIQLCGL